MWSKSFVLSICSAPTCEKNGSSTVPHRTITTKPASGMPLLTVDRQGSVKNDRTNRLSPAARTPLYAYRLCVLWHRFGYALRDIFVMWKSPKSKIPMLPLQKREGGRPNTN
jgi:hypothetical protein